MKSDIFPASAAGKILVSILAFVAISATGTTMAAINASIDGPPVTNVSNFEDFESYIGSVDDPLLTPNGFTFDCDCDFVVGNLGTGSQGLYQNGGSSSMTSVRLTSGANLSAISMVNGNGWGPIDPDQIWVRAYNNGSPVASFQFPDIPLASTIAVWADSGSQFDEVRIQSYGSVGITENEAQYGAIAIDDVTAGTAEPAAPVPVAGLPGLAVLIFLVMLLGVAFLRRRNLQA